MLKIDKPSIENLAELKDEATKNGQYSETEWIERICAAFAGILGKDLRSYRAFGPYWWLVKKELINQGYEQFGDFVDAEWYENMDYGDPFWNLIAAWLYQDWARNGGLIYSNGHPISVISDETDGPEYSFYTLSDEDMEMRAACGRML